MKKFELFSKNTNNDNNPQEHDDVIFKSKISPIIIISHFTKFFFRQ